MTAVRGLRRVALGLSLLLSACTADTVDLKAPELLLETPEVVDFGWMAAEESATRRFVVTNVGESLLRLDGWVPERGLPAGVERLEIAAQAELPVGASTEIVVELETSARADGRIDVPIRLRIEGLPDGDPRLPGTVVQAQVSPSGLAVEPNPLTLGPVPFLETITATVGIRNLRSRPVQVYAARHDGFRAQYDEAVALGSFGALPRVGADGLIVTLGPNETFETTLSYTAPATSEEAKEQAVWRISSCRALDPACQVRAVVQGVPDNEAPTLVMSPSTGVNFGQVPVGEVVERTFYLINDGERPLVIDNVRYEGSSEFQVELEPLTIPPGERREGTARFRTDFQERRMGTLRFETNDLLRPEVSYRLDATGVVFPPCRFEVSPAQISFGVVEVGATDSRTARVTNVGTTECLVFDPVLEATDPMSQNVFRFEPEPELSQVLRIGESYLLTVVYNPPARGNHSATAVLRTPGDSVEIPISGRTPGDPGILCSPDQATGRNATVGMRATLTGGARAVRYLWSFLDIPEGVPPVFERDVRTGPEMLVTPRELGPHRIEVEVEDDVGTVRSCEFLVVAQGFGMEVKMTWDGAGDLDLHMHRGTGDPWYGNDCHFENLRPQWTGGPLGQNGNPTLDRDDVSGDGPEYIRLGNPEIGVPYTIAVSHFERAAGRTARVELKCGRQDVVMDVSSPRPFRGADTGRCSNNDFWKVARVVFSEADTCSIEMLDTFVSSRNACDAY